MEDNRTLLIVDDEEETLKGYQEFLCPKSTAVIRRTSRRLYGTGPSEPQSATEQFRLILASSGEEAIKLFEAELKQGNRIAAGFFDVKLGSGMDGLATIHAIKAMDPEIHCVVVTAYHDRSVEEINQLFGESFKDQWDYLNKPFTQGEIVQKTRQMVAAWNRKKKLEAVTQQLVRSERLASIGQVARGVGHEFGNILQRIMGKVDLSLLETDMEKIKAHLEAVMKATQRAGVLVRNLQSFSKTEPNFQSDAIVTSLEESLVLIAHEFIKNSVQLEKDYKETPSLRVDTGAMAQVFLNLMINALHAMPQGGLIRVKVAPEAGPDEKLGVAVRIFDTGTGISPEVLPHIFDFAYSTKGDAGSGLGLSVSKDIVEAHGGNISVKTEVGKGTEFRVWLPINPNRGK